MMIKSAPSSSFAWPSTARSRFDPSEPIATSAAIPSTTDRENSASRRREARESRHAIFRMKFILTHETHETHESHESHETQ
jgi:hypothetical protein